jgi:hypothetical protein
VGDARDWWIDPDVYWTTADGRRVSHDLRPLFAAIREVESGGAQPGGQPAVPRGDNGRSRGPYQIGRPYWQDATARLRANGTAAGYDDWIAYDGACRSVMVEYWLRFCPDALAHDDWETLARVHNGGPSGATLRDTADYWAKVKAALATDH